MALGLTQPGGKGSRCVGLTTLHLHVPIVLKSGSLNLLEPSGPVQACNGIALPFTFAFTCLIREPWGSHDGSRMGYEFYPEDTGIKFLQNVDTVYQRA